jgi:hypothetical protein
LQFLSFESRKAEYVNNNDNTVLWSGLVWSGLVFQCEKLKATFAAAAVAAPVVAGGGQ